MSDKHAEKEQQAAAGEGPPAARRNGKAAKARQVTPQRKIVICATQRTGSTLLCQDLTGTGVLGKPREHFLPWHNHPDSLDLRRDLRRILKVGSTENGVFAVKLMANQAAAAERCLTGLVEPDSDAAAFPHLMGLFRGAVWVYLRRDNVIRQAISAKLAKKTNVFHLVKESVGKLNRRTFFTHRDTRLVDVEMAEITTEIARINQGNLLWRSFFEVNRIRPIELVYETFSAVEPADYLAPIASACNIERRLQAAPRLLQRMAGSKDQELYDRYLSHLFTKQG